MELSKEEGLTSLYKHTFDDAFRASMIDLDVQLYMTTSYGTETECTVLVCVEYSELGGGLVLKPVLVVETTNSETSSPTIHAQGHMRIWKTNNTPVTVFAFPVNFKERGDPSLAPAYTIIARTDNVENSEV
jgi:hypothetical protein